MAFTYDLTTTGESLLISKVRLLIPDNDATSYYLEDAEISYFLDQAGHNVIASAVRACRQLARRFALMVGFTADGLTMRHGERAKLFAERAAELEQEVAGSWSTVTLDRQDGYSDVATDTEYESRTVYIQV